MCLWLICSVMVIWFRVCCLLLSRLVLFCLLFSDLAVDFYFVVVCEGVSLLAVFVCFALIAL